MTKYIVKFAEDMMNAGKVVRTFENEEDAKAYVNKYWNGGDGVIVVNEETNERIY